MKSFRKGDRVLIEGEIDSDYVNDGRIRVLIEPYADVFARVSDITMKRPHIVVGDRVRKLGMHGVVMAIGEDHLWVSLGGGDYATWWAPDVERVDPEPAGNPVDEAA